MKIKILNKNNNSEYTIDEGAIITENFNETLDSANVKISHLNEKIDIEPYDEVILDTEIKKYYFCVDNYTCTMETIDTGTENQQAIYSYDINLFSQTKLLEGIVLPNLSITPRKIGTKRTIYNVLNKYLRDYGAKVRANESSVRDYSYELTVHVTDLGTFDPVFIYLPEFKDFPEEDVYAEITSSPLNPNAELGERFIIHINGEEVTVRGQISHVTVEDDIGLLLQIHRYEENSFIPKWHFDAKTQLRFSQIDCPELQWNQPTLREVFNDLMMVDDCIVKLENNTITFLDLTETKQPIPNTWNYIQESQSSDNYASEIRMNLQNVLQTSVENVNNTVNTREYLTFTCDDNTLTDENFYLKTQFPILNIKHLWICFNVSSSIANNDSNKSTFIKVDLCNLRNNYDTPGEYYSIVKESKEYQALDVIRTIISHINEPMKEYSKYSNFCVYFTRGSNIIDGFRQVNKVSIFGNTKLAIATIMDLAWAASKEPQFDGRPGKTTYYDYLYPAPTAEIRRYINEFASAYFEIEYETTVDSTFSASKQDYPSNDKVIIDNQTNSWVDAWTQGNLEYQKANRIGNQNLMINQRVTNANDIIKLQQTYDNDYIVYQVQYQVYTNHIEVNANATKNYVLKDYFTGISSRIRTWVNAQEEAFERHDLNKIYCEISDKETIETRTVKYPTDDVVFNELDRYFIDWFKTTASTQKNYIKYCFVKIDNKLYILECISRVIGNSIVLTTGFGDNWSFGKHFDTTKYIDASSKIIQPERVQYEVGYQVTTPMIDKDRNLDYGGIPLEPIIYVDSNGELANIDIIFTTNMSVRDNEQSEVEFGYEFPTYEEAKQHYYSIIKKPFATEKTMLGKKIGFHSNYLKDNKETPKYSYQVEYCVENKNDFYFTKKFIELQNPVRTIDIDKTKFKIYHGVKENIAVLDPNATITLERKLSSAKVTLSVEDDTYYFIYYDNELILRTTKKEFYFNFLLSRNKNIYSQNSDGEWIKTGDIYENND